MNSTMQFVEEGQLQLNRFDFAAAESNFRKALKSNSKSVEARIGLGRIEFLKEHPTTGLQFIDEALQIQPENAEALALKAVYLMRSKNWESAASLLKKACQIDPKLEMIYLNLAKCQRELGELKEAEEAASAAIKLNSENYQSHSELARILLKAKKVKAGMKAMNTAVRINPFYIQGYLVLARFYATAKKIDLAIQICKKGLSVNPVAVDLREMLAGLYAVKGEFQKAYIERVFVALSRNQSQDWLAVGNLAITTGRFERAEEAYLKALQVNPDSWEAHYNLGELYMSAKLFDKAKEQYQLAIENDGESFKPWNAMGLFLLDIEGNNELAKGHLIRALELAPDRKEPLLNLALTHAALRDNDAAAELAIATMKVSKPGDGIHEQAQKLGRMIRAN